MGKIIVKKTLAQISFFTGLLSTLIIVMFALQNDELIIAGRAGQVMRAASLLNSGADIQTEDRVCYF